MASALYDLAKKALLDGDIDLLVDNIKLVLVDAADYTVNLAAHQFLADVPAPARVATSGNLANKSTAAGVFDADDVTLAAVSGDPCEAVVLYQDTGNPATSRLIAYIDTATGLPVTPSGSDIIIAWSNGAAKIFALQ